MHIKILSKKDNKIVFLLKDAHNVFANTLRRIMLSEVPTLAVKTVTFVKNTSALFDEIIAHRLGMLPLVTDLESYALPSKCSCKGAGCVKCQVSFTIKAEGPLTVYASDLKSQDPKIKPAFGKMPLVQLLKGQELEFEAIVTLGIAKDHAKYNAGLVYYIGEPKVTINKTNNPEDVEKSCPTNVFELKGKQLKVVAEDKCILCNACVDINNPKEGIEVEASEKNFIFTIESYGKFTPEVMLCKALDVLDDKLSEFEVALEKV